MSEDLPDAAGGDNAPVACHWPRAPAPMIAPVPAPAECLIACESPVLQRRMPVSAMGRIMLALLLPRPFALGTAWVTVAMPLDARTNVGAAFSGSE